MGIRINSSLLLVFTLLLALLFFNRAGAQIYLHTDLSKKFNIKTELHHNDFTDSSYVYITITNKAGKKVQKISYQALLFERDFNSKNAVRSYTTHKNSNKEAEDNNYGDVIVADFNFDGREDLAIKTDEGGNGGPTYAFYLGDSKGRFKRDDFLSYKMEFFPAAIDKKNKTLTTYVHANAYQLSEKVFKLQQDHTWIQLSHKLNNMN